MAAPVLRPLTLGEVLDVSFGLYRSRFVDLFTIALGTQALPVLLGIYLEVTGGMLLNTPLGLAHLFLGFIAGSIGVAATTFVVSGAYLGEEVGAGDAFRAALPLVPSLLLLTVMTALAIGIGFVLLIVPGLILMFGLALSNVTLVLEAPVRPTDAMRRSWRLTSGHRGKVAGTLFVAGLLLWIPAIVVGVVAGVFGILQLWPVFVAPVLIQVLGIFVYPFLYVVVTVLYYDLRVRKEGFDLELLAASTAEA